MNTMGIPKQIKVMDINFKFFKNLNTIKIHKKIIAKFLRIQTNSNLQAYKKKIIEQRTIKSKKIQILWISYSSN